MSIGGINNPYIAANQNNIFTNGFLAGSKTPAYQQPQDLDLQSRLAKIDGNSGINNVDTYRRAAGASQVVSQPEVKRTQFSRFLENINPFKGKTETEAFDLNNKYVNATEDIDNILTSNYEHVGATNPLNLSSDDIARIGSINGELSPVVSNRLQYSI